MNVTLKNGKQGTLTIDTKTQKATLEVNGVKHLIAYIRDSKKVVIKNDMMLNHSEMTYVKNELEKLIKKPDSSKKGRK